MRLKSLDKYIKEKVQGYKAPYEAGLWKAIEEKLPTPRVPNGRGSWMLTAAAVVAIAVLAPFTMKFYNLTGRVQVAALKKDENSKPNVVILGDGSKPSATLPNSNLAINSMLPSDELKTFKTRHKKLFAANRNNHPKNFATNGLKNIAADNVQQQIIQKTAVASNSEIVTKKEMMTYISPGISTVESNAVADISTASDSRYPDRSNHHPINDQKWENWQSIYYPFWDNPAYTGSEGKVNVSVDYKTDNNISEPVSPNSQYTYSNFGVDVYSPKLGVGVGFFRLSELSPFSLQNTYGVALSKSIIQVGSTSIKIGVSGAEINDNLFSNILNYSDQINPYLGIIHATKEKNIAGTASAFALNSGLWISNPHVLAGLDVQDINQPRLGFASDALALPRQWRATLGYRFAIGPDLQFMPMAIVTRQSKVNQLNGMFTAVYKDKFMLSFAYENIDPISGLGNAYVYGSVRIAKRARLFGSYGRDLDLLQTGINETFVHAGLNFLVIR